MWIFLIVFYLVMRKDIKNWLDPDDKDDNGGNESEHDLANQGVPPPPKQNLLPQDTWVYKNIASSVVHGLKLSTTTYHKKFEQVAKALEPIKTSDEMQAVISYFGVVDWDEPWYGTDGDDWSAGLYESLLKWSQRAGADDEIFGADVPHYLALRQTYLKRINDRLALVNLEIPIPLEL